MLAPPAAATARVAGLLHEAGEAHHTVYRLTDGADPDWASWYSDWLLRLSELPEILGGAPVRSHLTALLVRLDREQSGADGAWEDFYAARIVAELGVG